MSDPNSSSGTTQTDSVGDEKKNQVSYETYLKVLAEAKKAKDENKAFKEAENLRKEQGLKDQAQWETLYKTTAQQAEEYKVKAQQLEESINNGMKINAFERALGGKISSPDYYTLIPFDKIAMNPETKKVDEDSAKVVAGEFLKNHHRLVEFQSGKMPNVASGSGKIEGKDINNMTAKELEDHIKNLSVSGQLKE